MPWAGQNSDSQVPPVLTTGGVILFRGAAHLAGALESDLVHRRLLAIDFGGIELHRTCIFRLNVDGIDGEVRVGGRAVYRQADLVGLEVDFNDGCRAEIIRLLGDAGHKRAIPDHAIGAPTPSNGRSINRDVPPTVPDRVPGAPTPAPGGGAAAAPADGPETKALWFQATVSLEPEDFGPLPTPVPGPTAPQVGAAPRQPVRSGTLQGATAITHLIDNRRATSPFGLLRDLQRANRAGQLTMHVDDGPLRLMLDAAGGVADFAVDLGPTLIEMGVLGPKLGTVLAARGTAVEQARFLLGLDARYVCPDMNALRTAMRQVLVKRLLAACLAPAGRYEFDPNVVVEPDTDLRLSFLDYVGPWIGQYVSRLRQSELEPLFAKRQLTYPVLIGDERWSARRLSLERQQLRFVIDIIPMGRPLRQLLSFSPLGRPRSMRLLLVLESLGMVEFREEKPGGIDVVEIETALDQRLARSQETHFGALIVHFAAHSSEYDEALARIQRKYGPDEALAKASSRAARVARQIVERAVDAHRFLRIPTQRIKYRRSLHDDAELASVGLILMDKMRLAAFRGNAELAHELQEMAVELGVKE